MSASFDEPLKHIEVTFRNMTHGELPTHYGGPGWWNVIRLAGDGGRLVDDVRDRVLRTLYAG